MSNTARGGSPVALVMGFGPFGDVLENPSRHLAEELNGSTAGPYTVVGRSMPVSYRRCLEVTARAVATHAPDVVLGIGVAVSRPNGQLERVGRAMLGPLPDVDDKVSDWRSSPYRQRPVRLPLDRMCEASGLGLSDDCGSYVCNGWLYACLGMLPERIRLGFLHIPLAGVSAPVVRQALAAVPELGRDGHVH